MNAGFALKRAGSRTSSAVPLIRSGPGWTMLSRLVCSIRNRSTCGVLGISGGKCPLSPSGATNPGPAFGRTLVRDARVAPKLALGDRRLAETLDSPGGQWGGAVGEIGPGPGLRECAVDGVDKEVGAAGDRRRDPSLDPDAERTALAINDRDNPVLARRSRRGAGQEQLHVRRRDRRRRLRRQDERRDDLTALEVEIDPTPGRRDPVGPRAAVEDVVAGTAGHHVVAVPAGDPRVPPAGRDPIVTGPADQDGGHPNVPSDPDVVVAALSVDHDRSDQPGRNPRGLAAGDPHDDLFAAPSGSQLDRVRQFVAEDPEHAAREARQDRRHGAVL